MDMKHNLTLEQILTSECKCAEEDIHGYWTRGPELLARAADYLNECLAHFGYDLDHDPFFADMPPFRDEFDYLLALFMKWGKPELWDAATHCLGGLSREEILCAFAHGQIRHARFLMSEDTQNPRPVSNAMAGRKIMGATRALAVINFGLPDTGVPRL